MNCRYCADGIVYDIAWTGEKGWHQVRLGKCKHCAGGNVEPSRLIRVLAERTGWICVRVIFNLIMGCLEFKLENHRLATEGELRGIFQRKFSALNLKDVPEPLEIAQNVPVAPAKEETGTEVPDYDFGDGWEPDPGSQVPF